MPKGKKGAGDPADGPDVDAGAKAIAEVMSLRTQLGMRQTALTDAETAKRQAEEKLAKLRADLDQEQATAYEISKDMTRQYKGIQEELLGRINMLEGRINEQNDQLERARLQLEETRREKAQELARKDAEIAEQKQKMEDMAVEFGEMLKETLDRMSERIEVSNSSWEGDAGAGVASRLKEFQTGAVQA